MTQPVFGRAPRANMLPPKPQRIATPVPQPRDATPEPAAPSVDEELRAWKRTRQSNFPWKTLSLVASASFGIASIALPKQINDWVHWPLYGLMAASLYAGFRRPKV